MGPIALPCDLEDLRPGDLVQLSFSGEVFQHTPVVVKISCPVTLDTVLIAAHSYDADDRPLSTYEFQDIRFPPYPGHHSAVNSNHLQFCYIFGPQTCYHGDILYKRGWVP